MNRLKLIRKLSLIVLLGLFVTSISSCNNSGNTGSSHTSVNPSLISNTSSQSSTNSTPIVSLPTISFNDDEIIGLDVDESYQLRVSVENTNEKVLFSSSKENIVSVNETGLVIGKSIGEAFITASVENVSDSIKVIVSAVTIENFSISSSKNELIVDESMVLNVSTVPTKYQDKIEFEVKSGQDCISIVNNKVTAIKTGTATVVAKYKTFVSNELEIKIFDFRISLVDNIVKKGNHVKVKFNSYPTGGNYGCSFIIADPSVISLIETMMGDVYVDGLSVGTTSFYLEKNGQRSNELTITVLDGNPYVNVDKNEFYANYTRSTSYQDSLYRTECDLMSGDITPQNQEPSISSNRPMSSGKYIRNSSQLYTNKNNTYTVLDSTGEKAFEVYNNSAYVGLEEVAAYIYAFGHVPCNYYEDRYDYPQPSQSIWGEYLRLNNSEFSGDVSSYPYEPKLPRIQGLGGDLIYYEVDIGTTGTDCDPKYPALNYNDGNTISRGAARIVYSRYYSDGMPIEDLNDRYVFYTYNHYNDFQEYLNYEGGWGEMFGNITGGGSISSSTNYNPTSYVQVIREDFTSKEFNN